MKILRIALPLTFALGCARPTQPKAESFQSPFLASLASNDQQRLPAPGTPTWNPSWYAATDGAHTTFICWDPATGSDAASPGTATSCGACSVGSTSLLTFAEIVRRYGSAAPTLIYGQNVQVCKSSAQSTGVDPVFFAPRLSGGGYAALVDTLVAAGTQFAGGVLGTVTPLSQSGGTDMTIASMPAGATAGMYIFDSQVGGYAFIESMSGTTATVTQPLNTSVVTTITLPSLALGTAWSTGDTATLYNIPNLTNLKAWQCVGGDLASSASVCWVQWTQIADSSGGGTSVFILMNNSAESVLSGVYVAPRLHATAYVGRGNGNTIQGSFLKSAVVGTGQFNFGADFCASSFQAGPSDTTTSVLNGNTSLATTLSVHSGGIQVNTGGLHVNGSTTVNQGQIELQAPLWGATGVTCQGASVVYDNSGSWAANFLWTGSNLFGTSSTGSRYVSAGVNVDGLTINVGVLSDAGSLFNPNSGSRFTIGQ